MSLPRLVVPGYPHHVVLRGNNRRRLFSYPRDYLFFMWCVERAQKRRPCALHAMVLMANHVHMIVTPESQEDLSRFIQLLAQRYATHRNRQRAATGKLFEQRYYSSLIASESYLAACTAYIELNPVRAGLVSDAADYRWSTYRLHANLPECGVPARLWTPSAWFVELGACAPDRAAIYRSFVGVEAQRHDPLALLKAARGIEHASETLVDGKRFERPNRKRAA